MKKRHKVYLSLNFISLIFVVASFIFTTLAWFAYSGLSKVSTDMDVKAWYIELSKNGDPASNNITITVPQLYPGMNTVEETINLKNLGDSIAQVDYEIVSARILDLEDHNYVVNEETLTSKKVEDVISHEYPFHINMSLGKNYLLTDGDETSFEVSVSWPLDSGDDEFDTDWGNKAYDFQKNEKAKAGNNKSYVAASAIKIEIKVTAEQYIADDTASDLDINQGDTVLYDVINDRKCSNINEEGCIKTTVLNKNLLITDEEVYLLPSLIDEFEEPVTYDRYLETYNTFKTKWNVNLKELSAGDLIKIISSDITHSSLTSDAISQIAIGVINTQDRANMLLQKARDLNGYFSFKSDVYPYLSSSKCFWTNTPYKENSTFALTKYDDTSFITEKQNTDTCYVIPVIRLQKNKITN